MNFPKVESFTSNNFIRLKDGESIDVVFKGDPYLFKTHWTGQKSEKCKENNCELCKLNNKARFRFRINAIIKDVDGASYICKILEQGFSVYSDLLMLNNDYPLEEYVIKISRTGNNAQNTKYSVMPKPNGKLNPAALALIKNIKILDLTNFEVPKSNPNKMQSLAEDNNTSDDIPF